MSYVSSKNQRNRKKLLVPALIAIVLVLFAGSYVVYKKRHTTTPVTVTTGSDNPEKIDLNPPSQEVIQETEAHKEQLSQDNPSTASPSPGTLKSVTPVITYADQNEVSSYVSGVIEDGGICTLTLTKASQKVTRQTTGERDATTTLCPSFTVPHDTMAKGTWTAVVTYKSKTAAGSSTSNKIEVN